MKKLMVFASGIACGFLMADTYTWNSTDAEAYMNVDANWQEGVFPAITNQATGSAADIVLGEGDPTAIRRVIMGNGTTFKSSTWINSVTGSKNYMLEFPRVNYSYSSGYWFNISDPSGFYGLWSLFAGPHRGPYRPAMHVTSSDPGKAVIHNVEAEGRIGFVVDKGKTVKIENAIGQGSFTLGSASNPNAYPGVLDIERSPGGSSDPVVFDGTLAIHGNPDPDAGEVVPGAWAHFDASDAKSLTVSGGRVTAWADCRNNGIVATRHSYASADPTLATDEPSGRNVVNFGAFGGDTTTANSLATPSADSLAAFGEPSGFALNEPSGDVREAFIVFQVNSRNQTNVTPSFLGVDDSGPGSGHVDMFQREPAVLGTPLFHRTPSSTCQSIRRSEIRLDGQRTQFDHADNLSESLHVLSVGLDDATSWVQNLAAGRNEDSFKFVGGIKIAEVVLYTNTLTVAERRRNNAILKRKWLAGASKEDYDYGYLDLRNTNSIHVVDGTAAIREVRVPDTSTKIVKTGAGSLSIGKTHPDALSVEVREGALWFAADGNAVTLEKAANPDVWLDATQIAEGDVFNEGGTNFVRVWRDPRGTNPRGETVTAQPVVFRSVAGNYAYLVDNAANGRPFVDFGAYHAHNVEKGYGRDTIYAASNAAPYAINRNGAQVGNRANSIRVREGFLVFKIASHPFCGEIFSTSVPDNYDFYVGTGSLRMYSPGYGNKHVEGAYWTLDGNPYDAGETDHIKAGVVYVASFAAAEPVPVDAFGIDRGQYTTGGISIGEWLAYDRQLTPEERRDTIAYLMKKWQNADHPDIARSAAIPSVTYADGLAPVVGSDRDITIGSLGATPGTPLVKKGSGAVTVGNGISPSQHTSLTVEGGTLESKVSLSNILARAALHLDANVGVTTETDGGGVEYMTDWADVRGSSYGHATPVTLKKYTLPGRPTVKTVTIAGREQKIVHCGTISTETDAKNNANAFPKTSAAVAFWDTDAERKRFFAEYYVIHADVGDVSTYNGVIGTYWWVANPYTDGNGTVHGNSYPFLRSGKSISHQTHGYSVYNGEIFVDNAPTSTNGTYQIANGDEFHLFAFTPQIPVISGGLGLREHYEIGGTQTGEFLCFATTNSAVDRAVLRAHLYSKWFGDGSEAVASPEMESITVLNGGALRLDCDGTVGDFSVEELSGSGAIDVGRKIGGVASLDVGNAPGGAGTLSVAGDLDISAVSQMSFDFISPSEYDSLTAGGTLALPETCVLALNLPSDLQGCEGTYILISGSPLSGTMDGWTVARNESVNGTVMLACEGNAVKLRIAPVGTVMILR